jgi:hypothetical protein
VKHERKSVSQEWTFAAVDYQYQEQIDETT